MMPIWLSNLRERSLIARTASLAAVLAGVFLLAASVAWHRSGSAGVAWAAVAGLACLVGSAAALVAGEPFRSTRRVLQGMLLGMAFRMGVPAVVATVAYVYGEGAERAGFLYYLAVFFEVALAVEVFLWLPPTETRPRHCVRRENGKGEKWEG